MAEERSVGELLDELFGFESVAKRQTALEQYDRGELLRKARSRELLGVIEGVEAAERAARESAVRAVDGYVRRVEFDSLARARKQVGVVGPLQLDALRCLFAYGGQGRAVGPLGADACVYRGKAACQYGGQGSVRHTMLRGLWCCRARRVLSDVRVVDAAALGCRSAMHTAGAAALRRRYNGPCRHDHSDV